jgi:predicted regulator of Ras-like GTPase activity (Roadblock/LC7/MglB family)
MTTPDLQLSADAKNFNWLLQSLTTGTAGVVESVAVSIDGLLMAMSGTQDRAGADRLSAVASSLASLALGASQWYTLGTINRVVVDMADGYLVVTSLSRGSLLAVIAKRSANIGNVAYEMTVFANRVRDALTPELIAELKASVHS